MLHCQVEREKSKHYRYHIGNDYNGSSHFKYPICRSFAFQSRLFGALKIKGCVASLCFNKIAHLGYGHDIHHSGYDICIHF